MLGCFLVMIGWVVLPFAFKLLFPGLWHENRSLIDFSLFWNYVGTGAVALSSFIALLIFSGLTWWLLLPLAVMVANFLAGLYFTSLPNTHLGEFRDALGHGEVLLMVDVPENQVALVEHRVHHQHPEAAVGGVGWGTQAFGL